MTAEASTLVMMPQPSGSQLYNPIALDGQLGKRPLVNGGGPYEDSYFIATPANDRNEWYYPSHFTPETDDDELLAGTSTGNWGKKTFKEARWIRRGKKVAWGPGRDDWEVEERARKRLRQLFPQSRSPSPPELPHLRSETPPQDSYTLPNTEHTSYAAFVLDPAIAHSFRSRLLADLERTTETLIEGEAAMKRILGRLWQVMSEDPDGAGKDGEPEPEGGVTKQEDADEDDDDMSERGKHLARAPDLSMPIHKLFLTLFPNTNGGPMFEPSHLGSPQMQMESLQKSLAAIMELRDDSREYVERLEEIRDGVGELRAQRDVVWAKVREAALEELNELSASARVPT